MKELFPDHNTVYQPTLPDGELTYYPTFLSKQKADYLFAQLLEEIPWQADKITVFGKSLAKARHSLAKHLQINKAAIRSH